MFRPNDSIAMHEHEPDGDGAGERLFDAMAQSMQHPETFMQSRSGMDGWGDRIYDYWKGIGLNMLKGMPEDYQDAMLRNLATPQTARILQGRGTQYCMQGIGAMLPGHGALYDPQYNQKILAEDAKGNVRALSYDQIYTLFPPATEDDPDAESRWPRILLTSSHARAGSLKDMTSITHGFEALFKYCFKTGGHEKHFEPMQFEMGDFWNPDAPMSDPQHKKLMIAFACNADKNPFLNGAALLRRIEELTDHAQRYIRAVAKGEDVDAVRDAYEHASPSSPLLAKVILQALVTEPERIDPNAPGFISQQKDFGDKPLMLRPDYERVASGILLGGYSKGGEVDSTTARFLVDQLLEKDKNGHSLFQLPNVSAFGHDGSPVDYRPIHDYATKENPYFGVSMVMRHIPVLSVAAIEVPLTEKMLLAGVRRVSINNRKDFISGHTPLRTSNGNDEVIWVDGVRDFLGHAPVDALGTRKEKGHVLGYVLKDETARRRIEELSCALYGAAAIANLQFHYDDRFEAENRIAIIPAAGTSDKDLKAQCGTIVRYLEDAGFHGVHVGPTEWNPSQILITMNEPLFVSAAAKADPKTLGAETDRVVANIEKLGAVFQKLREQEPDIVINQGVDADIDAHYRRVIDDMALHASSAKEAATRHRDALRARDEDSPAWLMAMGG